MNILVIGGGNMGKTFAESFLRSGVITPEQLFIFEKDEKRVAELNELQLGKAFSDEKLFFDTADIIILAVKPQDAAKIYPLILPSIHPDKIVLSIMAGIKMDAIKKGTGASKIVRSMPNLPCQVGQGATGFKVSKDLSESDRAFIQQLLATTGMAIEVTDEDKLDAITAISGSGPAYVFYFMDAMIQAGMQLGFDRKDATELVTKTFEGSLALFKENNLSCQDWIQKVSSKGGTTEAAITIFDQFDVKNQIGKGILRAENRSKELSKS